MTRYLLAAVLLLAAATADAHALLRQADPPVGSTLATPPAAVTLDYSEAVEAHFCRVAVQDAQGGQVDAGDLHVAPDNPKRLVIGLRKLPPGTYTVTWHVVSVDTHRTEGRFTFTVRP
jgi:methionine-rich copper-binding protein CopC